MFINLRQTIGAWIIKKIQRHGPHKVQVLGKTYKVSQDVLNPRYSYTSELMAKHINVAPEDEVLDMGTGAGILAITAGNRARRVIAVDINFKAVQFASKNVSAHHLSHVVFILQGDLFSSLNPGHKFSVILFTPPYMEGIPKTIFDHALYDPDKKLARRFFREAKRYLKPEGYVQMVYSSVAQPERVLKIARELGWKYELIVQKRTFTEKFFIYRMTLNE
ncbi:MAG: tRNA (adenine(22)-N(1))-methyltransferase TrmK [Thermodesulfovibrionia bacterium]|nr:tRNA (adenine(22)-N(1))-methyltransferase TrmK [Thermodesulfovibrionia bacterium]